MLRAIFRETITFLCIVLFVYAAVSKLMDYETFVVQIGQSPMLTKFSSVLAWLVPATELVIAGLLVVPRVRIYGLFGFFGMMIMFTVYIVLASGFSDYVPCSCGGVLQQLGWTEHLIFNLAYVALSFFGIMLHDDSRMAEPTEMKAAQ